MTKHVLKGDPPIPLILRRSAAARRISLRISQLDGRVTLTLPKRLAEREAIDFARSKEGWIRKHLDARGEDVMIAPGVQMPLGGKLLRVEQATGRRVEIGADALRVPGPHDRTAKRLHAYLREIARDRLAGACDDYAALLGRPYNRITLRDTRSRWGSCSSAGALMYSWRLIMAPPEVLDYVAAHEVAHLAEMNHSAAFWTVVADLMPDYAVRRLWLREEGDRLHRLRFDD